jgi:hypothetical protein
MNKVMRSNGCAPALSPEPLVTLDADTGEILVPSQDPAAVRAWIMNLTETLLAIPGEKFEFPVEHTVKDGMYMRKLFIPKGSLVVGKIHKVDCINIVAQGDISVVTETGSARVRAGYTVVSPAGIQKVGYAHEDTIFINVFRTDETDIERIEDAIAWNSYEAAGYLTTKSEGEQKCQLHG